MSDTAPDTDITTDTITITDWRALLPVHPAAELFPLISEAELKELASDIWKNGLRAPLVGWAVDGQFLLDGRNRLDALAQLGLLYETEDHHLGIKKWTGCRWRDRPAGRIGYGCEFRSFTEGDPYEIALSLNVHRRHLTADQRRELIAKVLKAKPGASNRQIAEATKTSHPTVAKVREELEQRGDVEKVSTSIDTKGREQPRQRSSKPTTIAGVERPPPSRRRSLPQTVRLEGIAAEVP
ncbi:MAG: hypothetical protein WB689_39330 [Xanthobacteraceae bacterium]